MRGERLRVPRVRESEIQQYLNWLFFENGYVVTKNSLLLAVYEIEPYGDYYSGDADDLAAIAMNRFLMGLPDGTVIWYECSSVKSLLVCRVVFFACTMFYCLT